MSLVDGSDTGYTPVFTFSNTTRHGWLCSSYQSGTCTGSDCPNNSSAQGGYWYNAVGVGGDLGLVVTGTLNCNGPEGVSQGNDPSIGNPKEEGQIEIDMNGKCH